MSSHDFHVIIVGGGIGGLCLAQHLKQTGISVALYERDHSRTARLQGYRIHINPAGSRALYESLPPRLFEIFLATCGKSGGSFNFYTDQLKEVLSVSNLDMGAPTDVIDSHKSVSRFSLRQVLLTGLDEIVHFNKSFLRYEETLDDRVTVFFEDGTSATGDVLIAADGSNSRIRQQFLPHARRIDTGFRAFQGKTPLTDELKRLLPSNLFDGPASILAPDGYGMFVAVQAFKQQPAEIEEISAAIQLHPDLLLSDTKDFVGWGFTADQKKFTEDLKSMDATELKQVVLRKIANWHPTFHQLLRQADPTTILLTPIYTSVPVATWQTRHITLIGDAIHSMTPARGIGANTALRDANLLGKNLVAASRGEMSLMQAVHDYEIAMLQYGFEAVEGSRKALEQAASLENPFSLVATKTLFRFVNAVPPLKRHMFKGMGE
jgi:salicylate hydroxylase